jgi:NAD+ diphosphatase
VSGVFIRAVDPPGPPSPDAHWLVFRGAHLLVRAAGERAEAPRAPDIAGLEPGLLRRLYLGALDGVDCYAAEAPPEAPAPDGMEYAGLRALYGRLDEPFFALAGFAAQIVEWDRTHQFCGRCGSATDPAPGERARRCPACGLLCFPRLSPAVIMLITRGDAMLLARAHNFSGPFYSTLAGFVEPGETLEEAVAREVREEVGIEIRDIRYFGSQPWPFPHSLMIGFTAQHAAGEIQVDGREIAEAGWFTAADLPRLPGPLSIARRLIDAFLAAGGPPDG